MNIGKVACRLALTTDGLLLAGADPADATEAIYGMVAVYAPNLPDGRIDYSTAHRVRVPVMWLVSNDADRAAAMGSLWFVSLEHAKAWPWGRDLQWVTP